MTVLLIAATTVAQNLNFTFTRGDANAATVTVSGDASEGVTATLVASGNWLTNGAMANATDVLCVNQNTNTGATITYTLTVSGLDNSHVFSYLSHTHKAVNSGGNYQPANDYDVRPRNFVITANDSEIATKAKEGIWIPSGQSSKTIEYQANEFSAVDGELKITISLYSPNETDEEKKGCFFGLTGVTISGNPYQVELESLIAEYEALNITSGTNVGDYTEEAVNEFNAAFETAKAVTEATENDVNALRAAFENLAVVLPAPNKFYYFDCTYKGNNEEISRKLYINANNQLNWVSTQSAFNAAGSRAVFQFEAGSKLNTVKIKSVHTQSYMGAISGVLNFGETGADITIAKSKQNNQAVVFTTDGTNGIHANTNPVSAWTNDAASNHYILTEVETFIHTLTVSEVGYSTLMLGFDATIPAGVECYYATATEGDVLKLAQVEGNVLPANTPVIVKAAADDYEFTNTDATATAPEGNLLSGTLYTKNVTPAENTTYYVLANGDEGVGLYPDALSEGIFRNNANKAYLPVVVESDNAAASYSFNFDWAGTTGIEGVVAESAQDGAIYDITGRRVKAITAPGIYIVNGRKVVK